MGEGNISRHEFYYELDYWEAIRIYNGIQRRYRIQRETSRQHDFMYLCAHWDSKNGPMPKSAYEWFPFPWDPVIDEKKQQEEHDDMMAMLRRLNGKEEHATE